MQVNGLIHDLLFLLAVCSVLLAQGFLSALSFQLELKNT